MRCSGWFREEVDSGRQSKQLIRPVLVSLNVVCKTKKKPLLCSDGVVRAELLAAEATDAAAVINFDSIGIQCHCLRRTVLDAIPATLACVVDLWLCCDCIFKEIFDRRRQAEIDISICRRTETGRLQRFNRDAE